MKQTLVLLCSVFIWVSAASAAPQNKSVKPNGTISFNAATGGVTRISIAGDDRIKEIVATDSNFEPKSNPDTGDVFLRFIGKGKPPKEDGFIVTEKGYTINYSLSPKNTSSETVLISLQAPKVAAASQVAPTGLGSVASSSDGYVQSITSVLRSVMLAHVDGRRPPAKKSGTVIANVRSGGFRARVLVVTALRNGAPVRAQSFFRNGVVAVVVDRPQPGPGNRTFVVVLEQNR